MGVRQPKAEPFWLNAKLFEQVVLLKRQLYAWLRLVELQCRLSLSLHQTNSFLSFFPPESDLHCGLNLSPSTPARFALYPQAISPKYFFVVLILSGSVLCRRPEQTQRQSLKSNQKRQVTTKSQQLESQNIFYQQYQRLKCSEYYPHIAERK